MTSKRTDNRRSAGSARNDVIPVAHATPAAASVPWRETLSNYPLVVVAGAVTAAVAALVGGMTFANSTIQAEVAAQLRERSASEVLYSINRAGETAGSVENIRNAMRDRRPISVKYAPSGDQKTGWTRRCDDFSVDAELLLRVRDTTIEPQGRQLGDPSVFEDHVVTSAGTREMRLNRIIDGRVVVEEHRTPSPVPSIEWTAPIISETK